MAKGEKLTPKQAAFIREYLISRNGTEAARKAGYTGSDKVLCAIATENLSKPVIQAYVQARYKKLEEKFEITQDRIVQELAAIAFGHAGKVYDWSEESMNLIPKESLTEADMKYIENITETVAEGGGRTVNLKTMASQKTKSLELLGKHIGMWKDKDAGSGDDKESRAALLGRVHELFRKRKGQRGSGDDSQT